MKLNQAKFLWTAKNIHPEGEVVQDDSSIICVNLRHQIQITHDYKKANRVEIKFKDDGVRFLVPDHNMLQEVFLIHLQNKDCVMKMRAYCEKTFERVTD